MAWEAYKKKFLEEVATLANQGNNILNFAYLMRRILTSRDVNIRLTSKQVNAMSDLE